MSNTKKPHIHAEIIKAWADGSVIEYYDEANGAWLVAACPSWHTSRKFRVKPEPTYPKTRLTGEELHEMWYGIEEYTEYADFVGLANHVIKEFIVSGQMDEYIQERNN